MFRVVWLYRAYLDTSSHAEATKPGSMPELISWMAVKTLADGDRCSRWLKPSLYVEIIVEINRFIVS
jgi:hypothetical protein